MCLTQTTTGQHQNNVNNVEVTNDGSADNPLLWMYSLVFGISLIAILLFSTARSVLLIKVNHHDHHDVNFTPKSIVTIAILERKQKKLRGVQKHKNAHTHTHFTFYKLVHFFITDCILPILTKSAYNA